jgi:hypothetical protein
VGDAVLKLQTRSAQNLPEGGASELARSRHRPPIRIGALTAAAFAAGALAVGAVAIGALAIGRLAIGRSRIRRLEIDELVVRRLDAGEVRIADRLETPNMAEQRGAQISSG